MPDVIIVEAPDAVMKYNDTVPNGFGILSYMICQSVPPDYFICCVPCDLCDGKFLSSLSTGLSPVLGSSITAAHVSNAFTDGAEVISMRKLSHVFVDMSYVQEKLKLTKARSKIPMLNVIDEGICELYDILHNNEFV